MATKEHKRYVRQMMEALEFRVHAGPPVAVMELKSVHDFLGQNNFSPASDYYFRLAQLSERIHARVKAPSAQAVKGNYGGESSSRYLQVQSVFDHVLLSTCYQGDFNTRHGRIKISHRFNEEGRIDFVELKFLRSLHPSLTGEIRKLLLVREYQARRRGWFEAEAFVLPVLPQELIFLFPDLFRGSRTELLAWLINIGHGMVADLVQDLAGSALPCRAAFPWEANSRTANGSNLGPTQHRTLRSNGSLLGAAKQMPLSALVEDPVAWPILKNTASLSSRVEIVDPKTVTVRYLVQRETEA